MVYNYSGLSKVTSCLSGPEQRRKLVLPWAPVPSSSRGAVHPSQTPRVCVGWRRRGSLLALSEPRRCRQSQTSAPEGASLSGWGWAAPAGPSGPGKGPHREAMWASQGLSVPHWWWEEARVIYRHKRDCFRTHVCEGEGRTCPCVSDGWSPWDDPGKPRPPQEPLSSLQRAGALVPGGSPSTLG